MYMTRIGIYINVQTRLYNYIFVYTWYKPVHTWYVQVLHSCAGTNMSVHGKDMSVPFCQILSRWSEFQMFASEGGFLATGGGQMMEYFLSGHLHHK